jgi:hypothetical protein
MLETGASVWLTTSAKDVTVPPVGVELPILLGDATIVKSIVVVSSPSAIVIELDSGHLRRLTPVTALPAGDQTQFPGSEWIVSQRVNLPLPGTSCFGLAELNLSTVPVLSYLGLGSIVGGV